MKASVCLLVLTLFCCITANGQNYLYLQTFGASHKANSTFYDLMIHNFCNDGCRADVNTRKAKRITQSWMHILDVSAHTRVFTRAVQCTVLEHDAEAHEERLSAVEFIFNARKLADSAYNLLENRVHSLRSEALQPYTVTHNKKRVLIMAREGADYNMIDSAFAARVNARKAISKKIGELFMAIR